MSDEKEMHQSLVMGNVVFSPKVDGAPNQIHSLGENFEGLMKIHARQTVKNLKSYLTGATEEIYWRYEEPEHKSAKCLLLTVGRVAVIGQWYGKLGEAFVAYSPMPKRDKEREEKLGLRETPDDRSESN